MTTPPDNFDSAAYGGPGWSPRTAAHKSEIGDIWRACGVDNEWAALGAVLLHRPGPELAASADPAAVQMLAPVDWELAQAEHDGLARAFRNAGVAVHYVDPAGTAAPNQMFVADLMFMTPEGAVLARPASTVRAGEERQVARRIADLGIPILKSLRGTATFEGADAAWLDPECVLIGRGLRTNSDGVASLAGLLAELGVAAITVDLPYGAMHLMGLLRFADRDLAIAWPRRTPFAAVAALRASGYRVIFLPDEKEASRTGAFNFTTLGPRRILMPAGNPVTEAFYREAGIDCVTVAMAELIKAAGAVGCLTGVLMRKSAR